MKQLLEFLAFARYVLIVMITGLFFWAVAIWYILSYESVETKVVIRIMWYCIVLLFIFTLHSLYKIARELKFEFYLGFGFLIGWDFERTNFFLILPFVAFYYTLESKQEHRVVHEDESYGDLFQ